MFPTPSSCSCPTPTTVTVPGAPGETGTNGADGTDGVNSFTTTTADFIIPTTGSSVDVAVAEISWMVVGQTVFASDGTNLAHFQVLSLQTSPPVATLKALGYNGDTAALNTVSSGATVTPAGVQGTDGFTVAATLSDATGGSQSLSATPSQALSTTLTLAAASGKTYLLFARIRADYNGATFAANQTITLTIRRTNNTAANIKSVTLQTAIITTESYSAGEVCVIAIPYTTVGTSDIIQPYVSISTAPSAGSVDVVEASITAVQLT